MASKTVLVMAGGTGGHVFPGLALAEEMKRRGFAVQWLGTSGGLEAQLVPAQNIELHIIPIKGIRGKRLLSKLLSPWNIVASLIAALKVVRQVKPDVVVGLGGYVAGPGGIAARLAGLPLVIHEQNAVAGTTNKLLAIFAKRVLLAFPCALGKGICIGNPVRKEIEDIEAPEIRMAGREDCVNVLVVGGSRGAKAINELVPVAFSQLSGNKEVNIRHQAGAHKEQAAIMLYQKVNVAAKVEAFIVDMAEALSWADFVICRAGALTVSELAAAGLGSVLIPFPYAIDDHQMENAKYLQMNGAALIQQQHQLTAEKLAAVLNKFLFDKSALLAMAKSARALAKPRAVEKFADYCEELVYV